MSDGAFLNLFAKGKLEMSVFCKKYLISHKIFQYILRTSD